MTTALQPDIVWIFLDQCRADVLGCYGHPFIGTPNLDGLAANGVLFENAFCQNPVCVPSRVSMLSGMYCHATGVFDNAQKMRPCDSHLLRGLNDAGYRTCSIGKVHLGITPKDAGFQEHRNIEHDGMPHTHVPQNYPENWPWKTFDADGYPKPLIYATDMCPRERTYCAVGVSEAIDVLESRDNRPLMLRLSLDRPHTPVSSPKPYDTMYAGQTVLPVFSECERTDQIDLLKTHIANRRWDRFTDDDILKIRYYYYGLVTHLDFELGRLLEVIDNSPRKNNTIVLLTADHGCMLGEHGLYVKGLHYYTETARVPFIISWPGRLPRSRRIAGLVEMTDLLPTLFELCDVPVPPQAVGKSLIPLIRGDTPGRDDVFAEQFTRNAAAHWEAVRTAHYVYTRYTNAGADSLFDLRADPEERNNLMLHGNCAGIVADMECRIEARLGESAVLQE